MWWPWFIVLVIATSCSVNVTFPENLLCSDGRCPLGQFCNSDGFCRGTSGEAIDAGPDGGTAEICGKSLAMVENFSGSSPEWWLDPVAGMGVVDFSGRLSMTKAMNSDVVSIAGSPRFDLRNSQWFAEVQPDIMTNGAVTTFSLSDSSFRYAGGQLFFDRDAFSVEYSPTEHRWWGFAEKNGALLFQTSPDAFKWTTQYTTKTLAILATSQPIFKIEGPLESSANASFDSINGGETPRALFCPATEQHDDFEKSGPLNPIKWSNYGACASVTQVDGSLKVSTLDSMSSCVIASNSLYDLTNSEFLIEHNNRLQNESFTFRLLAEQRTWFASIEDLEISVQSCLPDGVQCQEIGRQMLDPSQTHWRYRGDQGNLRFEVSTNGKEWDEIANETNVVLTRTWTAMITRPDSVSQVRRFN